MNLIEIRCPADAIDADERALFAEEILSGLVGDSMSESVPAETLSRGQAMTHVGFCQMDSWSSGKGPWRPGTTPPLWITVVVPELWRDEMSRYVIGWIRRSVKRLDARHGWERSVGDLWVNLTGVSDGSIGLQGKPATADDVVAIMTEEFRAKQDAGEVDLPEGVLVDPMCGMQVRLGKGAVTLEYDGRTVGFCAESCRDAYVRRQEIDVSQ